jgi:fucose 4-O-acetylase-like acetyltransferase
MKIFTIILSIIALGLIIFNLSEIDFSAPFQGDSMIAVITIVASLCVIVMMAILRISKRIEQKTKERR